MATEKRMMCVDEFKKNLCHYCNTYMSEEPCEPSECWVHDVIAQTDIVDAVEVVHGEWKPVKYNAHCSCGKSYGTYHYLCSACNRISYAQPYGLNYCPNCGAKMDGDGNG